LQLGSLQPSEAGKAPASSSHQPLYCLNGRGGTRPVKDLLERSMWVSFVSDPKLDGMVPSKPLVLRDNWVMSPPAQVTRRMAGTPPGGRPSHEHGSRRAPLQLVHPVMLVALAKPCHAAHETALRPLLLPVHGGVGAGGAGVGGVGGLGALQTASHAVLFTKSPLCVAG
jgi:hypothetical protein